MTFAANASSRPTKNKPVMLTHDGSTSPLALPAIDFLLLRRAFCIRKPRKSSCDAAYQKGITLILGNQGHNAYYGSLGQCTEYKISVANKKIHLLRMIELCIGLHKLITVAALKSRQPSRCYLKMIVEQLFIYRRLVF